jgi:ATP-binding protein involved in chromosome partitioning
MDKMIKKISEWLTDTSQNKTKSVLADNEIDIFLKEHHIIATVLTDEKNCVHLKIPYAAVSHYQGWQDLIQQKYPALSIKMSQKISTHAVRQGLKPLPNVRNIIAVSSGKGGVGKSTTAANLALALCQEGARVGLVDADVYGPSQVMMMGLGELSPQVNEHKKFIPLNAHGIQVMSMGSLVPEEKAAAWRGPIASRAMQQLIEDTAWDDLDYLIVDMPPGTGDFQLTLAQKIPVTAAIVITTPQDIALLDVRKSITMFQQLNIPVLGVIENMAVYHCEQCGHKAHIFGEKGADRLVSQTHTKLLARFPLILGIREASDSGIPYVVSHPESTQAKDYRALAIEVGQGIAILPKDYSAKMPQVVVQSS